MPDNNFTSAGELLALEPIPQFLTPQQRLDAITDILAVVTTRIINKRHENQNPDHI